MRQPIRQLLDEAATVQRARVGLGEDQRRRLTTLWHLGRITVAGAFALLTVALAFVWQWPEGVVVAGMSTIAVADSFLVVASGTPRTPTRSLIIEAAVVIGAMYVADVPEGPAMMGLAYLLVVMVVLLPQRYTPGMLIVTAAAFATTFLSMRGIVDHALSDPQRMFVGTTVASVYAAATLSSAMLVMRVANLAEDERTYRLDLEHAVAEASRRLLRSTDGDPLLDVLGFLREAVHAEAAYIELNTVGPDGPASTMLVEDLAPGVPPDPEGLWDEVPWSLFPEAHEALAAGHPYVMRVQDLDHEAKDLYVRSDTQTDLLLPIVSGGSWVGSLGFTDMRTSQEWSEGSKQILHTAAELIGAFWEREESRIALISAVDDSARWARLQQTLAQASRELFSAEGDGGIERALESLLRAVAVDAIRLERNLEGPDGPTARPLHEARREMVHLDRGWPSGAHREFPSIYGPLGEGRAVLVSPTSGSGADQELLAGLGVGTLLGVPVMAAGRWVGSLVLWSTGMTQFDPDEIAVVGSIADMIGMAWDRSQTRQRLIETVDRLDTRVRYEEAVAQAARELLVSTDERAMGRALEALLPATGAHEVNLVAEPVGTGPMLIERVGVNEALHGPQPFADRWLVQMLHGAVSERFAVVFPRRDEPDGADGTWGRTRLYLPIGSSDTRWGWLVLVDHAIERTWAHEELMLLEAVTKMLGAHLARRETLGRLEEIIRSKDELIAAIGHQIRTPLTAVLGFAEALAEPATDLAVDEQAELVKIVAAESSQLADIVDDLLVCARSDIGTLLVRRQPVSARDAIDQATKRYSGDKEVLVEGEDVKVLADPARLRQILRHLLSNATEHGGDRIVLRMVTGDTMHHIEVSDDGAGIDGELVSEAFSRFVGSSGSGGRPGSVGIGLAVSLQLAEHMGGSLEFRRQDGWTVFDLALPAYLDEAHVAYPGSST